MLGYSCERGENTEFMHFIHVWPGLYNLCFVYPFATSQREQETLTVLGLCRASWLGFIVILVYRYLAGVFLLPTKYNTPGQPVQCTALIR